MRWPWQRKEQDPAPVTPSGRSSAASSAGPPAAPPRQPAEPVPSPAGWAFLPPLQRTVGDLATTTAPHRFPDQLPTRTNPSFTAAMSHLISAEAPPGVIDLDGPDADPATGGSGSAARPVDMPLPPPRAPRGAWGSRPVQRLTGSGNTAQRSLTSAPEVDLGVLEVPVVHGTGTTASPDAPDAPAPPESSGAAQEGQDAEAGPEPGDVPAGVPSADPPPTGAPVAVSTRESAVPEAAPAGSSAPGSAPAGVPGPGSTRSGTEPQGRTSPPLPLQRRVPEPPGDPSRSVLGNTLGNTLGSTPGSTFDGTATSVPLPAGPPLQRSTGATGTGDAPLSAPSRRPSAPSSRRLGLGRPWPDPVGSPAGPSADGTGPPAVQRAPGSPECAPAPAQETPVGDDAPGRSSPDAPGPRAVVFTQPMVSRTTGAPEVPRAEQAEDRDSASTGMPEPDLRAAFADPPRFAGRQTPDPRRAEALPVVSRAVATPGIGSAVATPVMEGAGRVLGAVPAEPDDPRAQPRAAGAEPAAAAPRNGYPRPDRGPAVLGPAPATVQRGTGHGTAGTVERAVSAEETPADLGSPAARDVPAPTAGAVPHALLHTTAPDLPSTGSSDDHPERRSVPAPPGRDRPADPPVVSRSAAWQGPGTGVGAGAVAGGRSAGTGAAPESSGAAVDSTSTGPGETGAEPAAVDSAQAESTGSGPVAARASAPEPLSSAPVLSGSTALLRSTTSAFGSAEVVPEEPGAVGRPVPVSPVQRRTASHGPPAVGPASEAARSASPSPSPQRLRASALSGPGRPLGLRPPSSLPVVSRSVGDAADPRAAGTSSSREFLAGGSAAPTAPTVLPASPTPTAQRTPGPGPTTPSAASSLPAAPGFLDPVLSLPRGPETAPVLGAEGWTPRPAGGGRADEAPWAGSPVLSAHTGPASVPAGTPGLSSSPSGTLPAAVGSLQRSALHPAAPVPPPASPGPPTRPQPAPAPGVVAGEVARADQDVHRGPGGPPAAARADPVAMRLASTPPHPSRPGRAAGPAAAPGPGAPAGVPAVQRADGETFSAPEATGPVPTAAESGPTSAASVPAPTPAADEEMSQEQVDELAKRLVGPIVRRIKADMLLDRERRGLRIDAS
ncbi:hypothetical protein GCM10009767_32260 [Kocuria aegyptia]|uniref:Syndecan 1 n=1 Tax=Kocuria aegyptia TaxID=330943 RepID=A0ABN2L1N5_9MICC